MTDNKTEDMVEEKVSETLKEKPNNHVDKKHRHDKEEIKKIKEENEALKKQNQELNEKILISKAELINYRKRKEEEVEKMLKYANEDIALSILPTLDNFERAINMDDDNLEDEVSKFLSGFKMIYGNLKNNLEKYEIKAIDGINKPFDPIYHQAMMTEKREDIEPGIVIEILQKGYLLKDKVIRPAMVKVSE